MPTLNYPAILVAAVAYMIIMALWYSPLLMGKPWTKAFGKSEEELKEMRKGAWMSYVIAFICALVVAFALDILLRGWGIHRVIGAVKLGLLAGIGIAAASWLPSIAFERRSITLFMIDAIGAIISIVVMSLILFYWM